MMRTKPRRSSLGMTLAPGSLQRESPSIAPRRGGASLVSLLHQRADGGTDAMVQLILQLRRILGRVQLVPHNDAVRVILVPEQQLGVEVEIIQRLQSVDVVDSVIA